jgi:hypothetical protein
VADVEALAARDRKAQGRSAVGRRRRPRAADRALLAEGAEAIPVPASRRETCGLGVDAVRPRRLGELVAARDDVGKALVARDFPLHRDALAERIAGEPRPEHDAVGARLSRSDAEREAVDVGAARAAREPRHGDRCCGAAQEAPSSDARRDRDRLTRRRRRSRDRHRAATS